MRRSGRFEECGLRFVSSRWAWSDILCHNMVSDSQRDDEEVVTYATMEQSLEHAVRSAIGKDETPID